MTKRIIAIANGLGIEVGDHIIVAWDGHEGPKTDLGRADWSALLPSPSAPQCLFSS